MGNRYFTDEEVKLLQSNPYVKKVTKKSIAYSEEFKQLFIDDYENGMSPSSIFKKYGFDLNVLGENRRRSFARRVKKQSKRIEGFKDIRSENSGRPLTKELSESEIIERLKHDNEILQQENIFLKRIRFINKKYLSRIHKKQQSGKNTN